MYTTKKQLEEIVKEEVELFLKENEIDEGFLDRLKAKKAGLGSRLKSKARGALSKGLEKVGAPIAAGELASGSEDDIAQARAEEATALMNSHSKRVSKVVSKMIQDAEKLDLTKEPQMVKALSAVKGAVTRLNNILGS
jgi:cell division septum initiation protein DivIVA